MAKQTALQLEMAELLVESLNLEDISAAEIDPDAELFGDGLGLEFNRCAGIGVGDIAKIWRTNAGPKMITLEVLLLL